VVDIKSAPTRADGWSGWGADVGTGAQHFRCVVPPPPPHSRWTQAV